SYRVNRKTIIEKEQGLHSYTDLSMEELFDGREEVKEVVPTSPPAQDVLPPELFDATPVMNGKMHSLWKPLELGEEKSDEDMIIKRVQPVKRCSLEVHGSKPAPGCMYMYDRIEDKFNCLEDRIMKYSKALVASQLYEEVVDPSVASQKSIFAVGMICCEEEGRLKEKPIMLQSSVEHSGGQRVHLDLQKLDQFSIFPGQVRISLDLDNQLADPSDITSDLSLIIASGPYTTVDNMFFEPLSDLLAYAQRKQPQLLVLLGPFIDSEHPEIQKGALNRTYDELFRLKILRRLQDYVEYMGSAARVVLVPSIRDAHHDFVFPQPPFDINVTDPHQQITCITNPGIISANKVKIGYCSVDVLKQLSTNLVTQGIKNRMNTLTNHLLSQRSFYPLYTPAEDTPLDLSLAPEALHMSTVQISSSFTTIKKARKNG
ncbi:DNA polymerase alpha subunit B, partial [Tanacetum coccineum]